jgi:ELWxxDGT repeat protein
MALHQFLATLNSHSRRSGRRKNRSSRHSGLESLEKRQLLAADVSVLKDIGEGPASGVSLWGVGEPPVAEYNGMVYFAANGGAEGMELWRSNGAEAQTQLFVDLLPGSPQSNPGTFSTAIGKLFFNAGNPDGGRGSYVTDGTLAGTTLITAFPFETFLGEVGSNAYFYRAPALGNPGEIWKTDGSVAGTIKIADLQVADSGVEFDGSLFIPARSSVSLDSSLWKINPTNDTVQEVTTGPINVFDLKVYAGSLYFSGDLDETGTSDSFLLRLDSGAFAPALVQNSGSVRLASSPENKAVVAGVLYFTATSPDAGYELWRTDGTSDGTMLVKDIFPGTNGSIPGGLIEAAETLYFIANDGSSGYELWRSDGSEAGTFLVKDTNPGPGNSQISQLVNLNGRVVFAAPGSESALPVLWTSDGTESGTSPVNSTVVDLADSFVQHGDTLTFAAENASVGRELFILQLQVRPPAPVITGPTGVSSSLRPTVTWNAVEGATEYEVWISNNSTGENPLIQQIVSGTSFTPSSDLGIGRYTVWVRTLGTDGGPPSVWSVQFSFRIKTPVIQPSVSTDPANGFAMISWQALPGAVRYDVWIDRLDVPTSQIYRNTNVSGTSVTPTSLPNGRYRVWVRGLAADGLDGAWSLAKDFSTTQVPAITGGLNPTFDTSPTISWTSVPGAASYEVYVRSINGNFKALHQKNIVATTFTWPTLPAGPYEYWVRVTGATVWSNSVFINTDGRTNLLAPTGTTTNQRPVFSWQPVDGAVRYELWVDQLGVDQQIIYETNLTSASFTPPSNLPLGNYRVWVRAVGSSATAPWSPPVDFSIAATELLFASDNDVPLFESLFSAIELSGLLDENWRPVEVSREVVNVPGVPQEETAGEFALPAPGLLDSLSVAAVDGEPLENHRGLNVRTELRTAKGLVQHIEAARMLPPTV